MKRKSILSFLLAFVMTITAVMPAMAEDANSATGEDSLKSDNFSLVTSVSRGTKKDKDGYYTYICKTTATWDKNSAIGGEKYPGAGYDYIMHTMPEGFLRISDDVSISYNHDRTAQNETDYACCDEGMNYVKYKVADDPAGNNQMTSCTLTTTCKSKATLATRVINSYYVHTWNSVSLSASFSIGTIFSNPLSVIPSVTEKSWQVYSYAPFNF